MVFSAALPKVPALVFLAASGCFFMPSVAEAHFLDDPATLAAAIKATAPSFGEHPRVLKIEIDADSIDFQVQDPKTPTHVDEWVYTVTELGPVVLPRLSGPTPVQLQLLDPDLEANLFDLTSIDFDATAALEAAAIKRAHMEDTPAITRMEIVRRVTILPEPKVGDVRWTLNLSTGRESGEIFADAKGNITGADLAETRYAQTANLFKQPDLIGEATAAFRQTVSVKPIVLSIDVEHDSVGFTTNETNSAIGQIMGSIKSNASYSWGVNGLQRRLGQIVMPDIGDIKAPAPFSIDEIDWTQMGKLGADALARVGDQSAQIHEMRLEKSTRHPGAPALEWRIDIVDPTGAQSKVYADAKGAITEVVLPPGKQASAGPVNWLDPTTISASLSHLGANFPADTKIAEIAFDDRGGHVVIDDPANGGHLASFDFTANGVQRASMTMSMNTNGPRFKIADLASLNAARIAALEQAAMKRLAKHKKGYLNSFTIGPNMFDPQVGAKAVDIYVRDIPVDSAQANYAWGLYSFDGKYIDGTSF